MDIGRAVFTFLGFVVGAGLLGGMRTLGLAPPGTPSLPASPQSSPRPGAPRGSRRSRGGRRARDHEANKTRPLVRGQGVFVADLGAFLEPASPRPGRADDGAAWGLARGRGPGLRGWQFVRRARAAALHPQAMAESKPPSVRVPTAGGGWVVPRRNASCRLQGLSLGPREGFVLSQIDGRTTMADLELVTGLGPAVAEVVALLVSMGAVLVDDPEPEEEPDDLTPEQRRAIDSAYGRLEGAEHYELLGLGSQARLTEIREAYFRAAKVFHPDRHGDKRLGHYRAKLSAVFRRISEAHAVLADHAARAAYHAALDLPPPPAPVSPASMAPPSSAPSSIAPPRTPPPSWSGSAAPAAAPPSSRAPGGTLPPPPSSGRVSAPSSRPPRSGASSLPPSSPASGSFSAARPTTQPGASAGPVSARSSSSAQLPPLATSREAAVRLRVLRGAEPPGEQALRYVQAGDECVSRDDAVGAANSFRLAFALHPEDDELRFLVETWGARAAASLAPEYLRRAEAAHAEGNVAEAARCLARAALGMPQDAAVLKRAADALLRTGGDLRHAVDFARRAVALLPNSVPCRVTLAEAYLAAGLHANARREADSALRLAPSSPEVKALLKRL
jgi:hypothetical protein